MGNDVLTLTPGYTSSSPVENCILFDLTAEYPQNFRYAENCLPRDPILGSKNPKLSKNRSESSQWNSSDNEDNYLKTKESRRKNRQHEHTYKPTDFYYDVNKNGFRCDDFETMDFSKKSIIYLGCSHTFGVGLPEEEVWTYKVHKMTEEWQKTTYNYINLGSSGVGPDFYLHLIPYFKKLNPAYVFSYTPEIHRITLVNQDGWIFRALPEMLDSGAMTLMKYNKMAYKNLVMSGDNFFEYKKQISLGNINSLSEVLNFKFTEMPSTKCLGDYIEEYDWLEELHTNRFDEDGNEKENARDDAHYPAQYHTMVSKIIMSKLKEDK
jgi:hypothetical protein